MFLIEWALKIIYGIVCVCVLSFELFKKGK